MRILAVVRVTAAMVVLLPELAAAGVIIPTDSGPPSLPAPGILGLVALGVVGAIAFARSRK